MKKTQCLTKIKLLSVAAVMAPLAMLSTPSLADTDQGTLTVTATVQASCTVDDATLDFGTITNLANATTAQTGITITCTKGSGWSLALDDGSNTNRQMSNGTDLLNYELYTDSGTANVWATTCTSTPANPAPTSTECAYGVGTGSAVTNATTVYGEVPASQNVSAGSYTDTVTMTLTY